MQKLKQATGEILAQVRPLEFVSRTLCYVA